jgi:hypothetical protein
MCSRISAIADRCAGAESFAMTPPDQPAISIADWLPYSNRRAILKNLCGIHLLSGEMGTLR